MFILSSRQADFVASVSLLVYTGAAAINYRQLIHEKNLKSKISCQTPFDYSKMQQNKKDLIF